MDDLKRFLKLVSIAVTIVLYITVWIMISRNWKRAAKAPRDSFWDWICIGYVTWIVVHVCGIVGAFVWAWK